MTTGSTTPEPMSAELLRLVTSWAPRQRWFPAKGAEVALEPVRALDLPHPDVTVQVLLLRLPSGGVLQVPVVVRPASDDVPGSAESSTAGTGSTGSTASTVVGTLRDGRVVVDGCHDPAFLEAWFAVAAGPADGRPAVEPDLAGARVLTGEQSNTSVLLPGARPPAILKVFRGVASGPNPDVEVPLALSDTGWRGVPRPLAWLEATWPADAVGAGDTGDADSADDGGHLGVLSELVTDAEDGFEMACRWARGGRDLSGPAHALGRTTAQMHEALRRALPVDDDATPAERSERVLATLRERAASAVAAAPVLADRADRIDAVLSAVTTSGDLPARQRVHGDYHLGQVLHSAERGWVVLDFEGEPQASAHERTRPDLALRDLAGILRSVDYAAAVGGAGPDWTLAARDALVAGYTAQGGAQDGGPGAGDAGAADESTAALLRALELDKALYEVVYETRNRPTWVQIPLDGVDRLLADGAR